MFVSIESMKTTRTVGHSDATDHKMGEEMAFVPFISVYGKQAEQPPDRVNRRKFGECHELALSPSRPLP